MKRHLPALILALAFPFNGAWSQNTLPYYPFPSSNAVWTVSSWLFDHVQSMSFCQQTCFYGIWGDTVINSNTYHKVYTNIYPQSPSNFFDTTLATYFYSFREQGRKIAVRGPSDSMDVLHYDFNLDPGDTAYFFYDANLYPSPLLFIDSVNTTDGWRRHYNFLSEEWIEGIGSLFSTRYPFFYYRTDNQPQCVPTYNLECFIHNDTIKWTRYGYCSCSYLDGIQETDNMPGLKIFPNPASGKVTVTGHYRMMQLIRILDVSGRLIREYSGEMLSAEIDISSLEQGSYTVMVYSGPDRSFRKLLIAR